jgi:hypothetical protein
MVFGSFVGREIVDLLPETVFVKVIDLTLLIAGLLFLVRGS